MPTRSGPPLSWCWRVLCTANEVAVVMEAGPEAESFVNANGSDPLVVTDARRGAAH